MGIWSTIGSIGGGIIGTLLAPGAGTALGAELGGALGGAADGSGSSNQPSDQLDPNTAAELKQQQMISQLANSNTGMKAAGYAATRIRSTAQDTLDDAKGNSAFANNAAVQSAVSNKVLRTAETGIQGAYEQGSIEDERSKQGAVGANQSYINSDWQQRLAIDQRNRTPNFIQQLGMNATSSLLGGLTSSANDYIQNLLNP